MYIYLHAAFVVVFGVTFINSTASSEKNFSHFYRW